MRIAVTYANGEIFQHFGRTEQFKVYDVENGAVVPISQSRRREVRQRFLSYLGKAPGP